MNIFKIPPLEILEGFFVYLIKIIFMTTLSQNTNVIDYYYGFLENLKHDNKLDLISRLSKSLKSTEKSNERSLQSLFGAFKSK